MVYCPQTKRTPHRKKEAAMFTKVLYAAAILVLALLMEKTTSQADDA